MWEAVKMADREELEAMMAALTQENGRAIILRELTREIGEELENWQPPQHCRKVFLAQ